MNTHQTPALSAAVGLLLGTGLRQIFSSPASIPLVIVLLALALAADGWLKPARCLSAACLGLLLVDLHSLAVRDSESPELQRIDISRPVTVSGRIANHPVEHMGELWLYLDCHSLVQQHVVVTDLDRLSVVIGDSGPRVGLEWGQQVRLTGYLRQPRRAANDEAATPPPPLRLRLSSRRFAKIDVPAPAGYRAAGRLREALNAYLRPESPGIALARAVILGDRNALSPDWKQTLTATGLSHLLSISGLHVGLLVSGLWALAAFAPRAARWGLILGGLTTYVVLVGPRPAILRAAAMAPLWLLALACHRPPRGLNALCLWLISSLLMAPALVTQIGFQLTTLATAGILVLPAKWSRYGTSLPPGLRTSLAISIAAQLATLPVLLPLIGGFSPLTPLFNLLAIPWLASFLVAATMALLPTALGFGLHPWAVSWLDGWSLPLEALSKLEAGALFVPVSVPGWASWLLSLAVLSVLWRPVLLLAYGTLCLMGGAPHHGQLESHLPWSPQRGQLEVIVLDVGQGDAILLRDGEQWVLVDGGGFRRAEVTTRVLVPALARLGIRHLAAVVMTHPDRDHCQGLLGLRRFVAIDEVWSGPGWSGRPCAEGLLATARRWRVFWAGRQARVGRWQLEAIWPPPGQRGSDDNERSLVLKAQAAGRSVLLTGDIGHVVERGLVRTAPQLLRAEVLKVAHHGSKGSTLGEFVAAVDPSWALISAATGNPYGHPHPDVLRRLSPVTVLRTDRSGILWLRARPGLAGGWHLSLPASPRRHRP